MPVMNTTRIPITFTLELIQPTFTASRNTSFSSPTFFLIAVQVRVLISHILDHPGLVELDLSNNLIGDRGARAVGKFLNNHSRLTKLSLTDNQIRAAGAQAIAHALTKNSTLK